MMQSGRRARNPEGGRVGRTAVEGKDRSSRLKHCCSASPGRRRTRLTVYRRIAGTSSDPLLICPHFGFNISMLFGFCGEV